MDSKVELMLAEARAMRLRAVEMQTTADALEAEAQCLLLTQDEATGAEAAASARCPHDKANLMSARTLAHPRRYYCRACKQTVDVGAEEEPNG